MKTPSRSARGVSVLAALLVLTALTLVPATAVAEEREQRGNIRISKNNQFTAENGVRSGSGTAQDPYVFSGWELNQLFIHDTDAYVVIKDNLIHGQLTLNWIGDRAKVVDNTIHDLRVNENVKRTGDATSGLIARNKFSIVGQLRHFDGVFGNNVVDARDVCCSFPIFGNSTRAVNFDGFNGARFTNNTIYGGYVEARLHGHHHSSSFGDHSHYHGSQHEGHDMMDHSQRYHEVWITNNTIHSDWTYGLVYTDTAHSANDRTAASEDNEELNKPHVHYTRAHLLDNKLVGGGIYVDVFNADDRRHTATSRGIVDVIGNKITLRAPDMTEPFSTVMGIEVYNTKDIDLTIARNVILGPAEEGGLLDQWQYEPGIRLYNVRLGRIWLTENKITNREVGIDASSFKNVQWWIDGLRTQGVSQDVSYDDSAGPPNGGD